MAVQREFADKWAYDLDIQSIHNGEIYDINVLNQSIETILATAYGERLFNPSFGSDVPYRLFNVMSTAQGERILDDVATALKKWEDRITINKSELKLKINVDDNSVTIVIPYTIKRSKLRSIFKKKIINT